MHLQVLCWVVALFACSSAVDVSVLSEGRSVGWQLHSWDDLREWHQGFQKGARTWKFDPHYIGDAKTCSKLTGRDHVDTGCLILSHDNPKTGTGLYNTTDDILQFVRDNQVWFQHIENQPPVRFALCFKEGPFPCVESSEATDWLHIVDDFFENVDKLIADTGVSLEIILDGDGTPAKGRTCLKDRWMPWNSTWVNHPVAALESDAQSFGYERFQVLDDPENFLDWDALEVLNYGKFGRQTKYPLLLWEPSDEHKFGNYISKYQRASKKNLPSLTFAINIDPVMFQVYTAGAQPAPIPAHTQMHNVASFESPVIASIGTEDVIVVSKMASNTVYVRGKPEEIASVSPAPLPTSHAADIEAISTHCDTDSCLVLASTPRGEWSLFKSSPAPSTPLAFVSSSTIALPHNATVTLVAQTHDPMAVAVGVDDTGSRVVTLMTVSNSTLQPLGPSTRLAINGADTQSRILQVSVAALQANNASLCGEEEVEGFSTSTLEDKTISAFQFCVSATTGKVTKATDARFIDVGTSSRVTMIETREGVAIAEVHTDGFCFNSHKHNTQATVRMCAQAPVSTPRVLVYNYALSTQWQLAMASNETTALTSCNPFVLHGAYDQGTSPSVTFLALDHTALSIVEVHQGISEHDKDEGSCGLPVAFDGVMFDAWQLPSLLSP